MYLLLFTNVGLGAPSASILAGIEPRILTITANDGTLADYGFAPVGSPVLPTWGLRGRVDPSSGWTTTMAMSYGFALRYEGDNAVPTTTTQALLGGGPGHTIGSRGHVGAVFGFANLGHSVGSSRQGGALTYLGPYFEPRGSLRVVDGPGVVELSLAAMVQLPIGEPHSNPLWEDDFRRPVISGLSVGLHAGLGVGK